MDLDDELCLCFHVTKRKVVNFLRVEKPRRAGQLSQCFGAGTGCGWCRPFLERLFEQARHTQSGDSGSERSEPWWGDDEFPRPDQYAESRASYLQRDHEKKP